MTHLSLIRVDYHCVLEVLSPLHLGSGREEAGRVPQARGPDGGLRDVHHAAILRDAADQPYLPGSALKGALRATAARLLRQGNIGADAVAALFGTIKSEGGGRAGALIVTGASQSRPGNADGLPWPDGTGVFILARTAIHPGAGTTQPNRLFHAEAVAPGARFALRLRLETRTDRDACEAALKRILAEWAGPDGVAVGSDVASGHGRLRIAEPVRRIPWIANPKTGALATGSAGKVALPARPAPARPIGLRLRCRGPFLSRDPAWTEPERDRERARSNSREPAHLRALRRAGTPFLTGQAVSGVLRSRRAWLDALACHRAGKPVPEPTPLVRTAREALRLPSHERLFGVTGWRGLLTVTVQATAREGDVTTTSVRIDRFSGGTIDNALFVIDADRGVTITAALSLDERAQEADRVALNELLADLEATGLELGHGAGRGFGWFDVEVRR